MFMDKASYKHFFITLKKHRENKLNQIGIWKPYVLKTMMNQTPEQP